MAPHYDALLVVSFGGPERPEDVLPFLANVTRGRDVPPERLAQVAEQYAEVGGVSPINALTRELVEAVRAQVADLGLPVFWGNRNWRPFLETAVQEMADAGVTRALALVTSAYSSYSSCRQYLEDLDRARAAVGERAPVIEKLRQFFDHPGFREPFVRQVADVVAADPATHLVFVAHSIPLAMAGGSQYVAQLRATASAIAVRAGAASWDLAWSSRSGPPSVPWLEPDVSDLLRRRAAEGVQSVCLVPVGFVSDHMEVVYDLDVLASRTAAEVGLRVTRVETPGGTAGFAAMVRSLVEERLTGVEHVFTEVPRALPCGADGCCPAGHAKRPAPQS